MSPFNWPADNLCARDFMLLDLQFCRTIFYFLPCESVHFVADEPGGSGDAGNKEEMQEYSETWKAGVKLVRKERQPVVNEEGTILFLPIWENEKVIAVAVLSGGKSVKYGRYSAEWLHERSRLVSRELRKIKQWSFDPESGLLTGRQLRENIETLLRMQEKCSLDGDSGHQEKRDCWSVFLLEIFPKACHSGQSSGDIARAGACLNSFLGDLVPLNHFGSGLFGMLWNSDNEEEFRSLGYALLRKLKRQNFSGVHIGIAPVALCAGEQKGDGYNFFQLTDRVMSEALTSLEVARRRGPFALCSATGEMADQIFREPSSPISNSLKKIWRNKRKFSVVFVKKDSETENKGNFSKRFVSLVGEKGLVFPENGNEAYVYLPNMDGKDSLAWCNSLREKLCQLDGATYSMGIATFPCVGFFKADIPVNARKALAHTAFYGPDTATVFDGVTLNISGDVYYNEGDVTSAVKEYKRGLKLDPDNINLMNSLAVIYAQINRYHLAIDLFEKVIELDCKDFMALFNLGFAYLRKKNMKSSQRYFEKALAVDDTYFDLLLQLGQIYCGMGKYKKAVTLLSKAERTAPVSPSSVEGKSWQTGDYRGTGNDIGRGLVYTYLGQAYEGVGEKKKAMAYFQRAIGYNPKDAESLSRLGVLYLKEKQGNDIALSLCRQAVNVEGTSPLFWLRMARVHFAMKNMADSVESLHQCLTFDRKSVEALLLLGRAYNTMGQKHKAAQAFKKVLKLDKKNKQALRALGIEQK